MIDGDENVLGMFVERATGGGGPVPPGGYNVSKTFVILMKANYVFGLRIPSIDGLQYPPQVSPTGVGSVYYDSDDCSGPPYFLAIDKRRGRVLSGSEAYLAYVSNSIPLLYISDKAEAVTSFNQPLDSWNVRSVTTMWEMLHNA